MKKSFYQTTKRITFLGFFLCLLFSLESVTAQGVVFPKDFSPAEGLIISQEKPFRDEICLNGYWDVQLVEVPSDWKSGTGIAPELPNPLRDKWVNPL